MGKAIDKTKSPEQLVEVIITVKTSVPSKSQLFDLLNKSRRKKSVTTVTKTYTISLRRRETVERREDVPSFKIRTVTTETHTV